MRLVLKFSSQILLAFLLPHIRISLIMDHTPLPSLLSLLINLTQIFTRKALILYPPLSLYTTLITKFLTAQSYHRLIMRSPEGISPQISQLFTKACY